MEMLQEIWLVAVKRGGVHHAQAQMTSGKSPVFLGFPVWTLGFA